MIDHFLNYTFGSIDLQNQTEILDDMNSHDISRRRCWTYIDMRWVFLFATNGWYTPNDFRAIDWTYILCIHSPKPYLKNVVFPVPLREINLND